MSRKYVVFMMLFFCVVLGALYTDVKAEDEVIREGVYVESVDISGMTAKEAKKAIKKYVEGIKATKADIVVNDKTVSATLGELGYKWANTGIPSEAVLLGKKGNVIRRYKDRMDIDNNGKVFDIEMKIDAKNVKKTLKEICDSYNVKAQNASLKLTSSGFTVVPEQTGVVVDYDTTAADICRYIMDEWDKTSEVEIKAATEIDQPKYTAEDCKNVSSTPMGTFTTTFTVGASYDNRNRNIQNGARLLDGAFLYPEETYSLNDHLAPWTEENGYYPAGTYVDGGVEDSLGGGICQVSSTLYNALLLAEIEIVERYPHSMTVGYVPLSQDAALAGDYKDLVFKNNTDAPIYIQAIYLNGSITFNVYGHDTREAGRTVKYESERVSTTEIKTEVHNDNTKPKGYEEVVEVGHVGYTAKLWKHIYMNGEEIDKVQVNSSTYKMSPKKVIKGTKGKDDDKEKPTKDEKTTKKDDSEEVTKKKSSEDTTKKSDSEEVAKKKAADEEKADSSAQEEKKNAASDDSSEE